MDRISEVPAKRNDNAGGQSDQPVKEKEFIRFTNKRNFPINFSLRGKNYNAEVGGDVKIPAEHAKDHAFESVKKDLAEIN